MIATSRDVSLPLRDIWTISDEGKLRIELHPGQTAAFDSKKRFNFIFAGTQSGKTSFLPIWLEREIRERGRGDYLGVTATFDLFKLKFLPELQKYFVDLYRWKYAAADRVIWKKEKPRLFTRIILRSADAKGGLESNTAKGAILDECGLDRFRVDSWEAVERRLSLSQGRVMGGTTLYNLGWIKSQVYDRWIRGDPDFGIFQFASIMNPIFPRAEYYRQKEKLPAWKFRMMYKGQFDRPAGLIYGDFTDLHKIKRFTIPERWPKYFAIDPGGVHLAKGWIAQDPASGNLYLYRASLSGDKTTREHVKEVLDFGEVIAGAWGGSASEGQVRRDWEDAGLYISEPPISDVEAGIDRVIEMLKGKRFFVFDDLAPVIDEFGTYSRKLDEFGEPTEEIKDKNTFHLLDMIRYLIAGITEGEKSGGNYQTRYA